MNQVHGSDIVTLRGISGVFTCDGNVHSSGELRSCGKDSGLYAYNGIGI
jgi:hypothetical protein